MTAMGALSLRVDERTQEKFRMLNSAAPENPEFHRRRSVSLAMTDITANVQGSYTCYQIVFIFIFLGLLDAHHHRRAAQLGSLMPPGQRQGQQVRGNFLLLPNGRHQCQECKKDYATAVSARRFLSLILFVFIVAKHEII